MSRAVFRTSFLVGVLVLALCTGVFFALQYRQVKDETYAALRQEAAYAEQGLMLGGEEYLHALGDVNRITWISADGSVIYDNEFDTTANQSRFAEVQSALAYGEGQGIRKSESSGVETMYYARKCSDGTVLRLSRPTSAVTKALIAVSPVLWVLVLALVISIAASFRGAKRIVKPINEMDLDNVSAAPYPELTPLLERIGQQKTTIAAQLAERESLRKEFSANVSHELKTPLTSISGFAELMAQGNVPPDKVQEFSGDIYRESQRLIDLVNDIIHLSRLDEEGYEPELETVELQDLTADTIENLRATAEKADVKLCMTGTPVTVDGVWALLGEMVYNLCDNAIKYNRPGGIVTMETGTKEDGRPFLSVADTGIGIPKAAQDRVFERFYRVDKSHSKAIGGTGLGLSIVKHGAQYLGAEVLLESELGQGTTITLLFPKKA